MIKITCDSLEDLSNLKIDSIYVLFDSASKYSLDINEFKRHKIVYNHITKSFIIKDFNIDYYSYGKTYSCNKDIGADMYNIILLDLVNHKIRDIVLYFDNIDKNIELFNLQMNITHQGISRTFDKLEFKVRN